MNKSRDINKRIIRLVNAFKKDGYEVKKIVAEFGRVGIAAEHKRAYNYDTGKKKRAYYLEGTNYEAGYLMGLLAEREIHAMSSDFTNNMVAKFVKDAFSKRGNLLQEFLVSILYELGRANFRELPKNIRDEIQGIYDGCKKFNPKTRVDMKHLLTLNAGIDILCSIAYTGFFLSRKIRGLKPSELDIPIMCNGFSIFGRHASGGHYFGRDFMFPTVNMFHDVAAPIIYKPIDTEGKEAFPFVSIAAPGMVGSISAANINGVGLGVDMSPGVNSNPGKVGVNSILLTRICAQFAQSGEHAVEIMEKTQRGVSWNYIVADGRNDRACIVEAGSSKDDPDFFKYIPNELKPLLPDHDFISNHVSVPYRKGLMVRWNNYKYPVEYLSFNDSLLKYYNKKNLKKITFYPGLFSEKGYINKTPQEANCPSTYYFAPQRENNDNIVITTNHYIVPEMRLYSMYPWTASVIGNKINDIQWRYDELNNQILTSLEKYQSIDFHTARKLIDFLAPYGKHPWYYADNPKSRNGKELRIEGCTSIFDLKNGIVDSHFGYYCDEWVRITLPNYLA
jgi:hypothetical protein